MEIVLARETHRILRRTDLDRYDFLNWLDLVHTITESNDRFNVRVNTILVGIRWELEQREQGRVRHEDS